MAGQSTITTSSSPSPCASRSGSTTRGEGAGNNKRKATVSAEGERPLKRHSPSPTPSPKGLRARGRSRVRWCSRKGRAPQPAPGSAAPKTKASVSPLRDYRRSIPSPDGKKRSRDSSDDDEISSGAPPLKKHQVTSVAAVASSETVRRRQTRSRSSLPRTGWGFASAMGAKPNGGGYGPPRGMAVPLAEVSESDEDSDKESPSGRGGIAPWATRRAAEQREEWAKKLKKEEVAREFAATLPASTSVEQSVDDLPDFSDDDEPPADEDSEQKHEPEPQRRPSIAAIVNPTLKPARAAYSEDTSIPAPTEGETVTPAPTEGEAALPAPTEEYAAAPESEDDENFWGSPGDESLIDPSLSMDSSDDETIEDPSLTSELENNEDESLEETQSQSDYTDSSTTSEEQSEVMDPASGPLSIDELINSSMQSDFQEDDYPVFSYGHAGLEAVVEEEPEKPNKKSCNKPAEMSNEDVDASSSNDSQQDTAENSQIQQQIESNSQVRPLQHNPELVQNEQHIEASHTSRSTPEHTQQTEAIHTSQATTKHAQIEQTEAFHTPQDMAEEVPIEQQIEARQPQIIHQYAKSEQQNEDVQTSQPTPEHATAGSSLLSQSQDMVAPTQVEHIEASHTSQGTPNQSQTNQQIDPAHSPRRTPEHVQEEQQVEAMQTEANHTSQSIVEPFEMEQQSQAMDLSQSDDRAMNAWQRTYEDFQEQHPSEAMQIETEINHTSRFTRAHAQISPQSEGIHYPQSALEHVQRMQHTEAMEIETIYPTGDAEQPQSQQYSELETEKQNHLRDSVASENIQQRAKFQQQIDILQKEVQQPNIPELAQSPRQEAEEVARASDQPQLSAKPNNSHVNSHLNPHHWPSAPSPPTFRPQELEEMMARYEEPPEEEINILGLILDEFGRMDVDQDDPEIFNSHGKNIRARVREQRDKDSRAARERDRTNEQISKQRKLLDEATAPQLPSEIGPDFEDDYIVDILKNPIEELRAQKARLNEAEEKSNSEPLKSRDVSKQQWKSEAQRFRKSETVAREVHEKIYWSNLRIQAEAYAKGEFGPGDSCNDQIHNALLAWRKAIDRIEQSSKSDEEDQTVPEDSKTLEARAKLSRLLKKLPSELDLKVTAILNISTEKEICKTVDNVTLRRHDVSKILDSPNYVSRDPEGWLNDEIVNALFSALVKALNEKSDHGKGVPPYAAYNTSWLTNVKSKNGDPSAIQRWSRRKGITGEKLLHSKRIFFPVNAGNHWTLLVIAPNIRTIEYLDSLDRGTSESARKSTPYIKLARAWLKMELGELYVAEEWKEVDRRSAIQNNGSDCGMFACLNGVASALELDPPTREFGPAQIPNARRAFISLLAKGGFKEYFEL